MSPVLYHGQGDYVLASVAASPDMPACWASGASTFVAAAAAPVTIEASSEDAGQVDALRNTVQTLHQAADFHAPAYVRAGTAPLNWQPHVAQDGEDTQSMEGLMARIKRLQRLASGEAAVAPRSNKKKRLASQVRSVGGSPATRKFARRRTRRTSTQ